MNSHQAADYLETTISTPADQMSRPMSELLNAAARIMQRRYPGMAGYYDPEFTGQRIDLSKHLHTPARYVQTIPQSDRLLAKTAKPFVDPFAASLASLGIVL